MGWWGVPTFTMDKRYGWGFMQAGGQVYHGHLIRREQGDNHQYEVQENHKVLTSKVGFAYSEAEFCSHSS